MADAWKMIRYIYSTLLLMFSTIVVMALIFSKNTKLAEDVHPALAFVLIWVAIIWLSMVEGGQASLVGLSPIDHDLYQQSHPISHKICSLAHKGDNLDRYLMGRQFMVLALVFVTNMCGAPLDDAKVLGLPDMVNKIFLGSGLAMFFMTAMIGQLAAQVNAARCMLDYINTHFMTVTLYVALAIEASGLLHSCYLVQMFFARLAGQPIESQETPRTTTQNIFFYGRAVLSCVILGYAFAVTLEALFKGQTTMWEGVPPGVSVVLFFSFMSIVGMLEGMQIAFFAVAKLSQEERTKHHWAQKTCDLLFKGTGRNLPGFMVGRQMCVTMCFFIVARVTTIQLDDDEKNIFGASDGLQEFFNTGLLGAVITTIVASITWQLVASAFPIAFLSTPVTYVLLRFCLFLEFTGLCAGAWVLAKIHKSIARFQFDEVYVGTPEERAAKHHKDHDEDYDVKPGHLYPGVPALPPSFHPNLTLEETIELQRELEEHQREIEERLKQVESRRLKLLAVDLEETA